MNERTTELDQQRIKTHLRTLYKAQLDSYEWLHNVTIALHDALQAVRDSQATLPQGVHAKLDHLHAVLASAYEGDMALEMIQSYLDGELAG